MSIFKKIVDADPALKRGLVCCGVCKKEQTIDSCKALEDGWPKCCGYTMRLDEPKK
jgi:hypothetical protein